MLAPQVCACYFRHFREMPKSPSPSVQGRVMVPVCFMLPGVPVMRA